MSPRRGPRKPSVTVRLSDQACELLDAWAVNLGMTRKDGAPNRSEAIERLIIDNLHDTDQRDHPDADTESRRHGQG